MKYVLIWSVVVFLSACSMQSEPKGELYLCRSGEKVITSDRKGLSEVNVSYRGKSMLLHETMSASGLKYTSSDFFWWIKGNEATLFSNDGEVLESCEVQ